MRKKVLLVCLMVFSVLAIWGCVTSEKDSHDDPLQDLEKSESVNKDDFSGEEITLLDGGLCYKGRDHDTKYFQYRLDDKVGCSRYRLVYDEYVDSDSRYMGDLKLKKSDVKILNDAVARTDESIFYRGKNIKVGDFSSLVWVGDEYYHNGNQAYYRFYNEGFQVLDIVDVASLKHLDYKYAITDEDVVNRGKLIDRADPKSFTVINAYYSKDKEHVFYHNRIMENADPDTFELLKSGYARDKDRLYYEGNLLEGVNSNKLSHINLGEFKTDGNYLIYNGITFSDFDLDTFSVVSDCRWEDKDYVYTKLGFSSGLNTMKQTPKTNVIELYLMEEYPCSIFDVSNNNGVVDVVKVVGWHPGDWFLADNSCSTQYLPKIEEYGLVELEKKLRAEFGVKKMNFSYDFQYEILTVYKDHKYLNDTIVKGFSEDKRYAELSFNFEFVVTTEYGFIYDMWTGEQLSHNYVEGGEICMHDYDCISTVETEVLSGCSDITKEAREQWKIKQNETPYESMLTDVKVVNEDVEILSKEVKYPEGTKSKYDAADQYLGGYENMININYRHLPTGLELTVKNINEPQCSLRPVGFYGHPSMIGLVYLYVDSGCYHAYVHHLIISQSLLDQKLAQLYNNVGIYYYNRQLYSLALESLEKAVEINSKYGQAYFNQAAVYSLIGESDEALEALKISINLNPEKFKEKAKSDSDFDGIRESINFKNLVK